MKRIDQLDYLKCIFIVLMVIFHLVYINDTYPYIKQIVYTFHMPAFLIISGYLTNVCKGFRSFFKRMLWLFIPYAIMESSYAVMSTVLPVREKMDELTLGTLLEKVFVSPIGPYWYLHTLIICSVAYYAVTRMCRQLNNVSFLIALGLFLGVLAHFRLLSFANAFYFMAGVAVFRSKQEFLSVFSAFGMGCDPFCYIVLLPGRLGAFYFGRDYDDLSDNQFSIVPA